MEKFWPDGVADQTREDFDNLVNDGFIRARRLLEKYAEFFPLGTAISNDGRVIMFAADPGLGEQPPSQMVLEAMYDAAQQSRDQRRAFGFVADVRGPNGDAVRVDMEHRDGTTLRQIAPYTRNRLTKKVKYGEMVLMRLERRIWADGPGL